MTHKKRKADRSAVAVADPVAADDRSPDGRGDGRERESAPVLDLPPPDPDLYINRELSWLDFNRRVLEEAEEPHPLLERIKFAAIFCTNLDDWFMIRVAGLKRKLAAGIAEPGPDGRTPAAQFALVRRAA